MNDLIEMPKYKCNKLVHALKIAEARVNDDETVTITPDDDGFAAFTTDKDFSSRFNGNENDFGYFIVYDDGYKSWSPSAAFESGYSRL